MAAHQAPLSLGFSRQEHWSGLPFPSSRDLLTQGSNPHLLLGKWIPYCCATWEAPITYHYKNRQKNYTKKDTNAPDNHNSVIPPLEPDILECKVKWTLGNITTKKASGSDEIPVDLFQILKDDTVKVLPLSIPTNVENSALAMGLGKVHFHFNPKERQCQRMFTLPHNFTNLTC